MSQYDYDVVVLGGGPAGYPAAFRAADLGLKVAIVDMEVNPGGVCLYRGCIPSKALLHIAALINESQIAGKEFGVSFSKPQIDLEKVRDYKNSVIKKMTNGLGMLSKAKKVHFIQGKGQFVDSNHLQVQLSDGTAKTVSFKNSIIATGSRPTVLPHLKLDSNRVIDSTGALELKDIPSNMLCIGGGIIGMEIATIYSALGTHVSVVEMMPNLLGSADPELTKILMKTVRPRLKEVMLKTKVNQIKEVSNGIEVYFEDEQGKIFTHIYSKVLVCIGRVPNSSSLGLENTQVKLNEQGFIEVDTQCRTHQENIFAVGDIVGQPMLAHKGTHEGHVAAEVIAGHKRRFDPISIPSVVYTDPELAWCGVTESEAKEKKLNYKVTKFPWAASGRATALNRNDGLTKMIFEQETGQVIGVGIVGVGAGELIGEATLAVEMGATAKDIALTIHPHPTTTETIMESAELFFGHSDHYIAPKKRR